VSTGHFHQHTEQDPVVRTYSADERAGEDAVRLARSAPEVAVDIETAGLSEKAFNLKVVVVSTNRHVAVLDATNPAHRRAAKDAISSASRLVFHNSAYDCPPLYHHGLMTLADVAKVMDTLVLARMALPETTVSKSLEALEKRYLSTTLRSQVKGDFKEWAKVRGYKVGERFEKASYDDPAYKMYSGWDGIITAMLRPILVQAAVDRLTTHPYGGYGADTILANELVEREQVINRMFLRRSMRGLAIDREMVAVTQHRLLDQMLELEYALEEMGVAMPTKRSDLISVLQAASAFPAAYPRTPKTKEPSTKAEFLELVDHAAARAFVDYDKLNRLLGYLKKVEAVADRADGRCHPQVNVLLAATGRMSYGDPPLQQFIAGAREAIVADAGESLVSLDWSQIEPVLAANIARDTRAIQEFETGSGDLYEAVSSFAGISRKQAKTVLLAALYGQGQRKLALKLGVSMAEARRIQDNVASALPQTTRLVEAAMSWAAQHGCMWTLSGRIITERQAEGEDTDHRGINHLVQGSAYDVLAETLLQVDQAELGDAVYIAMHDEVVVEASAAEDIRKIMETPPPRLVEIAQRTPVLRTDRADLGRCWAVT
jgi:DNA polymerase-1